MGVVVSHPRKQSFGYYGGKFSKLEFILPQLAIPHTTYVELFAGSLSVLINKAPVEREVVNDLAEDVADFWRCLRDRRDDLIEALNQTPPGDVEYKRVAESAPTDDLVERARRFIVMVTQSFNNIPVGGSCSLCQFPAYNNTRDSLNVIADRMRRVAVENRDAVDMIHRINGLTRSGTRLIPCLIFADPPYMTDGRSSTGQYIHDDFDHERFLDAVVDLPPRTHIAISGYDSELYNSKLDREGWHRAECDLPLKSLVPGKTEVIWRNYELQTSQSEIEL